MIVIVAPYSPPNRNCFAHLGASRKLETIISILSRFDTQIVLVNSAHNECICSPLVIIQSQICSINLMEIKLPTYSSRMIGKLINIFLAKQVLDVLQKMGSPQLFWFYNGYGFEMRMASLAWRAFRAPMILEFEDWIFARSRGFNPKPYIDYYLWRQAAHLMSGTFAVNSLLAKKIHSVVSSVDLLPGVVPEILANIGKHFPPFSNASSSISIGFFGGLSIEKGADIVLKLATTLPEGYVLHVTGSGPLMADFEVFSREYPARLCYYGQVNDTVLYGLIAQCDVMLNPHSSIEKMDNGVFPFKVIEAVASGRLLISTALPTQDLEEVLLGVQFVDHSTHAFIDAIVKARERYCQHSTLISQCSKLANQRFGEDALLKKVKDFVSCNRYTK